ncbi:dihydrofolate reductase family protein [Pseudokineococcus sp. 1T1Z-3]|uniref:dihydrofolate reductase family protein n=1 Tax=Pseudokineococcus sp. 1T1Z-3 TaxID=3132745 RepID=UPI0030AD14CB
MSGLHLLHPPSLGAPRPVAGGAEDGGPERSGPEVTLAAVYAHPLPRAGRDAWVRANLVTTLDGAATGDDGSSRSISARADLRVLVLLRSLADVVLVGAGTARAESYGRVTVRPALAARREATGQGRAPALAVVTRSGRLPEGLLEVPERPSDSGSVLVVTCLAAGEAALDRLRARLGEDAVVVAGDGDVDVTDALSQLVSSGMRRVLCEGGPALLHAVAAADALDELCLTTSPLLVAGDGPRALVGPALQRRLRLATLLHSEDDGVLMARWTVER